MGLRSYFRSVKLKRRHDFGKVNHIDRSRATLSFERLEDRRVLSVTTVELANFMQLDATSAGLVAGPSPKLGYDLAAMASGGFTPSSNPYFSTSNSVFQFSDAGVVIQAVATSDIQALTDDLAKIGMTGLSAYQHLVTGFVPFSSIAALAALESLRFAAPVYGGVASVGIANSQGDESQRTDVIRNFQRNINAFNDTDLTGRGVTVGVISDSYDNGGAGSAATDIASGDLPGVGNPNGFLTPINVLQDNLAATDEGRAMLQIVHDVAPGSSLAFANVFDAALPIPAQTEAEFARNIVALADNGPGGGAADIIVDDLVFLRNHFIWTGWSRKPSMRLSPIASLTCRLREIGPPILTKLPVLQIPVKS